MSESNTNTAEAGESGATDTRVAYPEVVRSAQDAPEMFYVKGATGPQRWFDGENVLISAGVAWRSRRTEGFASMEPEDAGRLFIDSGGFQASAWFLGNDGGDGYPYDARTLFEWAEEVGADYVAGMDYACERRDALAATVNNNERANGNVEPSDIPPVAERIEMSIEEQIEQARIYDEGDWSFDFVPVVQGLTPEDYRYCARRLREAGVARTYMGIGTVCCRSDADGIRRVLTACREELPHTAFHLFGLTRKAWEDGRFWSDRETQCALGTLRAAGDLPAFVTADTHAWAQSRPETGSWPTCKEEIRECFHAYHEQVEGIRAEVADAREEAPEPGAPVATALGPHECACGTRIPVYGTDFEPGCRHCQQTAINRRDAALARKETAHPVRHPAEADRPPVATQADLGVGADESGETTYLTAETDGGDPDASEQAGLGAFGDAD